MQFSTALRVCLVWRVAQLSGERVLTMEWVEGCKLTDVAALRAMRLNPRDVALDALHAFAQMVFVDGFGRVSSPC